MKKNGFILFFILLTGHGLSQPLLPVAREIVVANGGTFEFTTPYTDFATLGVYSLDLKTYNVVDTIRVQSVQDLDLKDIQFGGELFLAAEDSIVKYNAQYQREAIVDFQDIRSVTGLKDANIVVAGRWFGSGDYVKIFDYNTLIPLFSVSDNDIANTVYGAAAYNDSLYVSYNLTGTIDYCPPYGCYTDTIGMLGVIDLNTQTFVRNINLGVDAAGLRDISIIGTMIYGIAERTGRSISYDINSGTVITSNSGISQFLHFDPVGDIAVGIKNDTITMFHFYNGAINTTTNTFGGANAAIYDNTSDIYACTTTDFASYGKLFVQDPAGTITDSVTVDIAPDAIAFRYESIESVNKHQLDFSLYPNPLKDRIYITISDAVSYHITDINGRSVQYGSLPVGSNEIQIDLLAGLYYIKLSNSKAYATKSFIVQH